MMSAVELFFSHVFVNPARKFFILSAVGSNLFIFKGVRVTGTRPGEV